MICKHLEPCNGTLIFINTLSQILESSISVDGRINGNLTTAAMTRVPFTASCSTSSHKCCLVNRINIGTTTFTQFSNSLAFPFLPQTKPINVRRFRVVAMSDLSKSTVLVTGAGGRTGKNSFLDIFLLVKILFCGNVRLCIYMLGLILQLWRFFLGYMVDLCFKIKWAIVLLGFWYWILQLLSQVFAWWFCGLCSLTKKNEQVLDLILNGSWNSVLPKMNCWLL